MPLSRNAEGEAQKIILYFFWGDGCPHCIHEKEFLAEMVKKYPELVIKDYEVWHNPKNAELFARMAKAAGIEISGVPTTFIDDKVFVGFSADKGRGIESVVKHCTAHICSDPMAVVGRSYARENHQVITLPFWGNIDASKIALPVFTVILAGLDSFNPCAFFVIFFLLSLLIHARSRKRMFLIGGIFVSFSGVIYFLFMSAWLNIFLLVGRLAVITTTAALIAIAVASINIKDFFLFGRGVSLVIPEGVKPGLFSRMRNLLKSTSNSSMITGTVVLAIAANTYELLCTAGFPLVFTRVLTLHNLPPVYYYFYIVFYNIIYVLPLTFIVFISTITMGAKKLTEWEGRKLKLISGIMMLGLGIILLIKPVILNNVFFAAGLLAAALIVSWIIIFLTKKYNPEILRT